LLNLCRETLTFESFLRKFVENVNIDMKTVNGFDVPAPEGRSPVTLVRGLRDAEEQRVYALYKLYGLRLDKRDFRRTFGKSIYLAMPHEVAAMEALGLVRNEGRELVVTRKGLWAFSYLMKGLYINVSHIRATAIRNGI
jgi:coproporphyrinogen III oxidase-like Fe-S oxidoreductase